jgi:hypothetical protein
MSIQNPEIPTADSALPMQPTPFIDQLLKEIEQFIRRQALMHSSPKREVEPKAAKTEVKCKVSVLSAHSTGAPNPIRQPRLGKRGNTPQTVMR